MTHGKSQVLALSRPENIVVVGSTCTNNQTFILSRWSASNLRETFCELSCQTIVQYVLPNLCKRRLPICCCAT